jgi:hypothetical protein
VSLCRHRQRCRLFFSDPLARPSGGRHDSQRTSPPFSGDMAIHTKAWISQVSLWLSAGRGDLLTVRRCMRARTGPSFGPNDSGARRERPCQRRADRMAAVGTTGSTGGKSAAVMRWIIRSALERSADATGLLKLTATSRSPGARSRLLLQLAPWHAVRGPGGQDGFYVRADMNGT